MVTPYINERNYSYGHTSNKKRAYLQIRSYEQQKTSVSTDTVVNCIDLNDLFNSYLQILVIKALYC